MVVSRSRLKVFCPTVKHIVMLEKYVRKITMLASVDDTLSSVSSYLIRGDTTDSQVACSITYNRNKAGKTLPHTLIIRALDSGEIIGIPFTITNSFRRDLSRIIWERIKTPLEQHVYLDDTLPNKLDASMRFTLDAYDFAGIARILKFEWDDNPPAQGELFSRSWENAWSGVEFTLTVDPNNRIITLTGDHDRKWVLPAENLSVTVGSLILRCEAHKALMDWGLDCATIKRIRDEYTNKVK